jgi:hypothetical protein
MENSSTSAGERVVAVVQWLVSERSILRLVSSEDTLAEAGVTSRDAVRRVLLVEDDFGIPVSELTLPELSIHFDNQPAGQQTVKSSLS